jgi:hypothetical protein
MRGPGARWFVIALAIHGVVLALLFVTGAPRPKSDIGLAPPSAADEFDLDTSSPVSDPGPVIASAGATALAVTRATVHPSTGGSGPAPRDSTPPGPGTSLPAEERPLDLSREPLGLDPRSALLRGLGGTPESSRSTASPERNEAPGMQQSVRDALQEHDRALGLGAGGPIVGVAEDVARASVTPWNSRATFEVVADATGAITAVRLVDASEAWGDWERVASDLREALRRLALRVPKGASGLEATIEVTSRFQLPSGHDPVTEVSVFGVPVKKAPPTAKRPMRVDLLKPQLAIVDVAPSPDLSAPIKLPEKQLVIGIGVLGLAVDPTDLTPRPLRVVHARVTREHSL